MMLTSGSVDVVVGLMDGPVVFDHTDLTPGNLRMLGKIPGACRDADSVSCLVGWPGGNRAPRLPQNGALASRFTPRTMVGRISQYTQGVYFSVLI